MLIAMDNSAGLIFMISVLYNYENTLISGRLSPTIPLEKILGSIALDRFQESGYAVRV
jgi:hypothetical protein